MKKQSLAKRIVIGLTGGFGSGKSTVAKMFRSFGAEVIDADKIAHSCICLNSGPYKKIVDLFGKGVLGKKRLIDRKKIGEIVFANRILLKSLNEIIHPEVIKRIKARIKRSKSKAVVIDAPLLIEAGLESLVDELIVVKASLPTQIKRIRLKKSLSRESILRRIKYQIPLKQKIKLADFIIDNNGAMGKTRKQAIQIRRKLWKN